MKKKIAGGVSFRAYEIISDAVERGVQRGTSRAYKYSDNPTSDYCTEQIEQAVMSELCEILDFGGGQ